MAEISKLVDNSGSDFGEMGVQKIEVSNHNESSMGTAEMSDSFILDMENLSPQINKDNYSPNPRLFVKLQRNLSRKGSPRGERNKTPLAASGLADAFSNVNLSAGGGDPYTTTPTQESINKQSQQTITIMAENCSSRKYVKNRTSFIDPKRVLLFFATMSSMGTIVLIYFTLSISKFSGGTTS
ncbi:hypothetical protein ACHQM5_003710 [Ranunculus cassubicifolius]